MKIFQLLKLSFLFVFIFFVPNSNFAEVYYVNGICGDDDDNGKSINSAWETIVSANVALRAGDTVYIMAGIYCQEPIRPDSSGSEGNYITYKRYKNDEVIITNVNTAVDLNGKSYIVIDGIKILHIENNSDWVRMRDSSHHNIIQNCYFEGGKDGSIYIADSSSYNNKILNNILKAYCGCDSVGGPSDLIKITNGSHHNLIEGNRCYNAPHVAICIQDSGTEYNIVRHNYIQNKWHTNISLFPAADHSLVEGNLIFDGGEDYQDNLCSYENSWKLKRWIYSGLQNGSSFSIIRKNIFVNNGRNVLAPKGSEGFESKECRIYQNTFFENYYGIFSNTSRPCYNHRIENNIFFNNRFSDIFRTITGNPNDSDIYYIHNNIYNDISLISGPSILYNNKRMTLAELEHQYPCFWSDNLSIDPIFVDEDNRDFHLRPDSPMIDAGIFLTITTTSGHGKTIQVEDARYFMDGWGVINGDIIQLEGQTKTAMITNVDYNNNIITVDQNLIWKQGVGVSLAYQGSAPDIGVYEFFEDIVNKK